MPRTELHQASCIKRVASRSCQPGTALQPGDRGGRREANIPAQCPPPCQEARISCSDEHACRPGRAQEPTRQGPRPTLGLIRRIRERNAFDRLSRDGQRIRRSALWCTWCPDPDSPATFVAFAIGRAFGPAVRRNRIRRRLRALLGDIDRATPLPPGMLLIGAHSRAIELTFDQLAAQLDDLVRTIRASSSRSAGPSA